MLHQARLPCTLGEAGSRIILDKLSKGLATALPESTWPKNALIGEVSRKTGPRNVRQIRVAAEARANIVQTSQRDALIPDVQMGENTPIRLNHLQPVDM
jgi:hypothetical protein